MRPRDQPVVKRDTMLLRRDLNVNRVQKLLRILPDLTCVRAEREPETDQVRLQDGKSVKGQVSRA